MEKTVQELQDEVKVLKNEIKETLTDIREHLLTYAENPFATTPVRPMPPNGHSGPGGLNGGAQAPVPGSQSTVVSVSSGHDSSSPQGDDKPAEGTKPEEAAKPAETAADHESPATAEDKPGPTDKAVDAPATSPNGRSKEPPPQSKVAEKTGEASREEEDETVSSPSVVAEAMENVQDAVMEEECLDRVEAGSNGRPASAKGRPAPKGEVKDLFTVATLAPWMEDNVARLGKDRVKAIVEVYASMRGMCDSLRDVLLKLVSLDGVNGARPNASLRECMKALAELDNLLWRSRQDPRGAALYAALLNYGHIGGLRTCT